MPNSASLTSGLYTVNWPVWAVSARSHTWTIWAETGMARQHSTDDRVAAYFMEILREKLGELLHMPRSKVELPNSLGIKCADSGIRGDERAGMQAGQGDNGAVSRVAMIPVEFEVFDPSLDVYRENIEAVNLF